MRRLVLRPFKTARTYHNLKSHGEGVFHVIDDALLLARAAIGPVALPPMTPAETVRGWVLTDTCRAYEFRVASCDDSTERASFEVEVVRVHRLRDFFGFNRARHAVVEAAILATRVHLLDRREILAEYDKLDLIVGKTGGPAEHAAMALLRAHVASVRIE